jgi:hypothetical protein
VTGLEQPPGEGGERDEVDREPRQRVGESEHARRLRADREPPVMGG